MNNQALKDLEKFLDEWTSTPMGRRAFLSSLPILMAACSSAPSKTRYREGDNSGQNTEMTVADELKLTQEVMPQMKKDYPTLQNPELQTYISGLGKKLVAANKLDGNPYNYNFTVVDVDYVNAFALPAGTVFVTTPLIALAETEAELAGVVGHEIGHIRARHTAERMEKQKKEQNKTIGYTLGGALLGGLLGYGVGRAACKKGDDDCIKKAAELGAGAGGMGGLLIQRYAFMQNSREDEMEADRIGFRTSVAAGYDKDKVGLFYAKLLQMEKSRGTQSSGFMKSISDAMSTHPPSQERVNQMNELAAQQKQSKNAISSTIQFDKMRKIAQNVAASKPKKAGA